MRPYLLLRFSEPVAVTSIILLLADKRTFMLVNIRPAENLLQPLARPALDRVGFYRELCSRLGRIKKSCRDRLPYCAVLQTRQTGFPPSCA